MSLASVAETVPVMRSSRLAWIVPRRKSLLALWLSSGPSRSSGCDRSRLRSDGRRIVVMSSLSVDVALVAPIVLQALEILLRGRGTKAAFRRHDRRKRQVDVGREAGRVAADVEVSSFLEPGEDVAGL